MKKIILFLLAALLVAMPMVAMAADVGIMRSTPVHIKTFNPAGPVAVDSTSNTVAWFGPYDVSDMWYNPSNEINSPLDSLCMDLACQTVFVQSAGAPSVCSLIVFLSSLKTKPDATAWTTGVTGSDFVTDSLRPATGGVSATSGTPVVSTYLFNYKTTAQTGKYAWLQVRRVSGGAAKWYGVMWGKQVHTP